MLQTLGCTRRIIPLLAACSLFLSLPAAASFAVSTLDVNIAAPAGQTQTRAFQVINTGDTTENIRVSLLDWDRDTNGNHSFYEPGTLPGSLSGWLDYSPKSFRLDPGKSQDIRVTVSAPEEATGSRWSIMMVETEPRPFDAPQSGLGLQVRTRYGVKIIETVPGTEVVEGRVTRLSVSRQESSSPPLFTLQFWNTGNIQLRPKGWFELRNAKGETLWQKAFDPAPVLPDAKVNISTTYEGDPLGDGRYLLLGVVDYGGPSLVAAQAVMNVQN